MTVIVAEGQEGAFKSMILSVVLFISPPSIYMHSGEIKSRSPFSTETDDSYCLEALGSLWPVAVVFPGLPGSKNH